MLPPKIKDNAGYAYTRSEPALVKVKGSDKFWIGWYYSDTGKWSIEGSWMHPKVTEWWPLPKERGNFV